eukprot:4842004-Prymnesium_polylepis.1
MASPRKGRGRLRGARPKGRKLAPVRAGARSALGVYLRLRSTLLPKRATRFVHTWPEGGRMNLSPRVFLAVVPTNRPFPVTYSHVHTGKRVQTGSHGVLRQRRCAASARVVGRGRRAVRG